MRIEKTGSGAIAPQLWQKVAQGYERIVGDLVIIEPREMGTDETGEPEEWRWLQPYVLIRGENLEGWRLTGSDSLELRGHFLSDIKAKSYIRFAAYSARPHFNVKRLVIKTINVFLKLFLKAQGTQYTKNSSQVIPMRSIGLPI